MKSSAARKAVAKAVEMHEKALAIYEELDCPEGQVDILQHLAKCYRTLGDDEKALQLLDKSMTVMQALMQRAEEADSNVVFRCD
jgi:tetratricopeptide (TPR) repeat protein